MALSSKNFYPTPLASQLVVQQMHKKSKQLSFGFDLSCTCSVVTWQLVCDWLNTSSVQPITDELSRDYWHQSLRIVFTLQYNTIDWISKITTSIPKSCGTTQCLVPTTWPTLCAFVHDSIFWAVTQLQDSCSRCWYKHYTASVILLSSARK